jgi:hypothetical protein
VLIPKDTKIELVALEPVSSGNTNAGAAVRFAVVEDVVVDGVTVIHRGTFVNGTVTNVRRGSPTKHKWGYLRIKLSAMRIGKQGQLSLTGVYPMDRKTPATVLKSGLANVGYAALDAAILPFIVIYVVGDAIDGKVNGTHPWGEAELPLCYPTTVFVSSKLIVSNADLVESPNQAGAVPDSPCFAAVSQRPKIDWSGAGEGLLDIK